MLGNVIRKTIKNKIMKYSIEKLLEEMENSKPFDLKKEIRKCKKMMNSTNNYYEQWFWLRRLRLLTNDY